MPQYPINRVTTLKPRRGAILGTAISSTASMKEARKLKKEPKMSKFKQWLRNWLNDQEEDIAVNQISTGNDIDSETALRFEVIPARGGVIVTVRHYDRQKDRFNHTNHVIHDDENIAEHIGQLVSMELLRS
jgi:hypothetical protein